MARGENAVMKTSLFTVLCTAIRLGAVWLGVNVLLTVPGAYTASARGSFGKAGLTILLVWGLIALFVAFLLWLYPSLLARLAAGKSAMQVFESPISPAQLQYIALVLLGMWFLMTGVVTLSYEILRTLLFAQVDIASDATARMNAEILSKPIIQILCGSVLTLGSSGLVGLLHRLRETSLAPAVSETAEIIKEGEKT
jgi:hypothetical protein